MNKETLLSILKWVLIVFAAGFVGYFGRHLSKIIIGLFSKESKSKTKREMKDEDYEEKLEKKKSKNKYKLEKKRLKNEQKKAKKE